jgi:hypothetical protein
MFRSNTVLPSSQPGCFRRQNRYHKIYQSIRRNILEEWKILDVSKAKLIHYKLSNCILRCILDAFEKLRISTVSPCLSGCSNSAPTGRIFMKFNNWLFFERVPRKFVFHWNLTKIKGTLLEDLRTFVTNISPNSSWNEWYFRYKL